MIVLKLARRFPGADLDAAWQEGMTALQANAAPHAREPSTPRDRDDSRFHRQAPGSSDTAEAISAAWTDPATAR